MGNRVTNRFIFINKIGKSRAVTLLPAALLFIILIGGISGCADSEKSDAYGQFEADETTISSESSGKLIYYEVDEGYTLEAGQQVANVDTTALVLQKEELEFRLESVNTQIPNIDAEIAVQQENLQAAERDLHRIERLAEDGATTAKSLDDATSRVQTLRKQIGALQVQKQSVHAEAKAIQASIRQLEQRITDASVINPLRGTVLANFSRPFEVVQQGQPLYRIANLDTLLLRVYISGAQLPEVKIGQQVEVLVDKNAEENQRFEGEVKWIASEAEFTPKMIQTKEERVTQVYAVEIKVTNRDGILKIGMPGEVNFSRESN